MKSFDIEPGGVKVYRVGHLVAVDEVLKEKKNIEVGEEDCILRRDEAEDLLAGFGCFGRL